MLYSSRFVLCFLKYAKLADAQQSSVGFESIGQSVVTLVSDEKTVEQTLGFLASFALHNFSLSSMFIQAPEVGYEDIDVELRDLDPMLKLIRYPGALKVMYNSMHLFPTSIAPRLRYTVFKLMERLAHHSHRNHAVLTNLDLAGSLFESYCSTRSPTSELSSISKQERHIISRLLKRLLELGVEPEVAKHIFQRAVTPDNDLDGDVLDVLRAGMKTRWPEHISLEGQAGLTVRVGTGLPQNGFTFMVRQ